MPVLKLGSAGGSVVLLQRKLNEAQSAKLKQDGDFGPATEAAVLKFQAEHDLVPDGMVGPVTAAALDKCSAEPLLEALLKPADPATPKIRMGWQTLRTDPVKVSSLSTIVLREDACRALAKAVAEIRALGGVITSAGGRRALTAGGGGAQSASSFHYPGLAFDLAVPSTFCVTEDCPYLTVPTSPMGKDDKWTFDIFCKSSLPSVSDSAFEALSASSAGGKLKLELVPWSGRCFSLTAILRRHGFRPIPARAGARSGYKRTGNVITTQSRVDYLEAWHFQYEACLAPGGSTFGEELLRVYDLPTIQRDFAQWERVKGFVFGSEWR